MKKYELTSETKVVSGKTLFRIKAITSFETKFGKVSEGDLGGFIENDKNLDRHSNAWVSGDARVYGNALVYGNARVYGDAMVSGDARVSGDAMVYGDARVSGDAWVSGDALVYGNARVYGDAMVSGDARVSGDAMVYGNARVYGDAMVSGDARVSGDAYISWFSNVGSENGTLTAYVAKFSIEVTRGCFKGTLKEFEEAVEKTHGDNQIGKEYKALIEFIKIRFKDYLDKNNEKE